MLNLTPEDVSLIGLFPRTKWQVDSCCEEQTSRSDSGLLPVTGPEFVIICLNRPCVYMHLSNCVTERNRVRQGDTFTCTLVACAADQ